MDLKNLLADISKLKELNEEKTVVLEDVGLSLVLRSLSSDNEAKLHADLKDFTGAEYIKQIQRKTISYALVGLNKELLEDYIFDEKDDAKIPRHEFVEKNILKEMPEPIVERLFKAYAALSVQVQEKIKKSVTFDGEEFIENLEGYEDQKSKEYFEDKINDE